MGPGFAGHVSLRQPLPAPVSLAVRTWNAPACSLTRRPLPQHRALLVQVQEPGALTTHDSHTVPPLSL